MTPLLNVRHETITHLSSLQGATIPPIKGIYSRYYHGANEPPNWGPYHKDEKEHAKGQPKGQCDKHNDIPIA